MKRASHVFEKIVSEENIAYAIYEVNRTHRWLSGHRPNKCTQWVERTFPERVAELKAIIENGFEAAPPKVSDRYDKNAQKWRTIYEPKQWPDQYVHHALMQQLVPLIERRLDPWCTACIPGRGIHYAKRGVEYWMRHKPKGTKYVFCCDIYHFFPSTDPEKVMEALRRLIKDHRALGLAWSIIKDGIFPGYYPSHWLANMLLQPLDRLIREDEACKHYIRHMDNITIFSGNKRKLRRLKDKIVSKLNDMGFRLKGDWQIYATKDRLPDAVGFRFGRTFTIPRKRKYLKLKRMVARYRKRRQEGKPVSFHMAAGLLSRIGDLKHCNSFNFYKALFRGERLVRQLKKIIRKHSKTLAPWSLSLT